MTSVSTTNFVSRVVLDAAFEAGAVACAAAALSSPIGALGGAVFGGIRSISQFPLAMLVTKCLNINNPQASSAAKTLAKALVIFGSYSLAWGALAAAGVTLPLSHVVSLTIVSIFTSIAIALVLTCLGIASNDATARNARV